jgi:hypothetical protein
MFLWSKLIFYGQDGFFLTLILALKEIITTTTVAAAATLLMGGATGAEHFAIISSSLVHKFLFSQINLNHRIKLPK